MGLTSAPVRRLGLLGGSFDPVHCAHLALAQAALEHLELDEVVWLPAGRPWQKESLGATGAQRVAMLRLALAGQPRMRIDTQEVERAGATYTIDTLIALGAGQSSDTEFVWLLGSDQLRNFSTWHRWRDIVTLARLAVAQRPQHDVWPPPTLAQELSRQGRELLTLPLEPRTISATDIRQRVARGQSLDGLVPPAVLHYIQQHHLYQSR